MTQQEKLIALGKWYAEAGENNNGWKVMMSDGSLMIEKKGPNAHSDLSKWIINEPKPEKKIDMSVCIQSGIDVVFRPRQFGITSIGQLVEITENGYTDERGITYGMCELRMNHWYAHNQSDTPPIPEGFLIEIFYLYEGPLEIAHYKSTLETTQTDQYNLNVDFWSQILNYRILEKLPKYKYDWEK